MQASDSFHHHKPPKKLLRVLGRAIHEHNMIHDQDRLLLGLSGGKDSLSLLHLLKHIQAHAPVKFELAAITIDPQIPGFNPQALKAYLQVLNIPYFYQQNDMVAQAEKQMKGSSFCAYCSRIKRGIMYRIAREQGYNVLVLGQHLDDLAESFLMSAFHTGQLSTMKAHYTIDAGDLRVIRPLVYARERQLASFAKQANFPVVMDSCPACYSKPTQREAMKILLAEQESQHGTLFKNLLRAMMPLLSDDNQASNKQ